jgi:hypothetical protein
MRRAIPHHLRPLVFSPMPCKRVGTKPPELHDLSIRGYSPSAERGLADERASVKIPRWRHACNPCEHGTRCGTRSVLLFSECFPSLVSRDFLSRAPPGLWRSRWPVFATAPSFEHNRQRHAVNSVGIAGNDPSFYGGRQQHNECGRELEREWNLRRKCNGRNDNGERRLCSAG